MWLLCGSVCNVVWRQSILSDVKCALYGYRLYVSYSVYFVTAVLLIMQVPFIGFQPVQSSEHMVRQYQRSHVWSPVISAFMFLPSAFLCHIRHRPIAGSVSRRAAACRSCPAHRFGEKFLACSHCLWRSCVCSRFCHW